MEEVLLAVASSVVFFGFLGWKELKKPSLQLHKLQDQDGEPKSILKKHGVVTQTHRNYRKNSGNHGFYQGKLSLYFFSY